MRATTLRLGGALLVAGIGALTIADNDRPWRHLQVEFFELERQQLERQIEAARAETRAAAAAIEGEVEAAWARLDQDRDQVARLATELRKLSDQRQGARRRSRDTERALDEAHYRLRQDDSSTTRDEITSLRQELLEHRIEIEGFDELISDRERKLDGLRSPWVEAAQRRDRHAAPIADLERRRAEIEDSVFFRRLPVLGIFHPSVQVREVSRGAAPERCTTCHLGADRPGFDDPAWPRHFRSHPRLDLYISPDSPHPATSFACTDCHGGQGRATGFDAAGHVPATAEQARAWAADWGLRPERPTAAPRMRPLTQIESSCAGCHSPDLPIPEAPNVHAGLELVRRLGCDGCHGLPAAGGEEGPRDPGGPALGRLARKTTPEWTYRWLDAPRDFSPTTPMPHLFGPADGEDPRRTAELLAVVELLWRDAAADPAELEPADPRLLERADPEAGRALFGQLGCDGCHLIDPAAERSSSRPDRLHGPNLARIGSKVGGAWLVAWLRDPQAFGETAMPDLRLREREAADLAAYLLTRRDPDWEGFELPGMPTTARDELVLEHLRTEQTVEVSAARLEAMSARERNLYLGKRTVLRYGCQGCHAIPGLEEATPIDAGDLRAVAARWARSLDVSHLGDRDLHPRLQSSTHPLAGLENPPAGPDYGLTPDEAQAISIGLLALGQTPPAGPRPEPHPDHQTLVAGRKTLDRYGCRGCHALEPRADGKDDPRPGPSLAAAGARFQPSWLTTYLKQPDAVRIRPWLEARMPTFPFRAGELETLVRYFAARDRQSLLVAEPPAPSRRDLTVGAAVYSVLQCFRCHAETEDTGGYEIVAFAPSYTLAKERLRPRWVEDWILHPERWAPGTAMPTSLPSDAHGRPDSSFLAGNMATPMFWLERDRLRRVFDSETELEAYLGDPKRVAAALRDHLWTLEE